MAREIARSGGRHIEPGGGGNGPGRAIKKHAKKHAAKKDASKKHLPKKHAAKKQATHGIDSAARLDRGVPDDLGLMTAFHHLQRASVVISLMEQGTGEDLRDLLDRGVKLYRKALDSGEGKKHLLRAIGVLRAAEHLSMAGLYAAREKHSQKVPSPGPKWLEDFVAETDRRLDRIKDEERGKGVDLFPVTVELLRQAEEADHDAHMAFELAIAADALCFALENGL